MKATNEGRRLSARLIDAAGREHQPISQDAPPRIVSLVPSITELLCDLGLAHWLVGRTGFCVHPKQVVSGIAKVGGTKTVNLDKIRALAPTHLIVNIDENEKPTVDLLAQSIPHIVVTHPLAPRDNLELYRLLGGLFGAQQAAERLCSAFEQEYGALAAQAASARPREVLYCIWKDPWMTVAPDTYIAQMLALIGWRNWSGGVAGRYPQFAWSEQLLDSVDEVLLSSEPYRFTETHVDALERQIGKPVRLVDGELISWYGSRAIGGLRYLRQLAATN
jgi:ABC-type Fe3+-hydroxamate transport system substrate-binding protein